MSFELIAAEEAHYPKALMCRALGLSRSGHHSFRTRSPSKRALGQRSWTCWSRRSSVSSEASTGHHVEEHHRPIPDDILAAGNSLADPDERVIAMLGARSGTIVRGNAVAKIARSVNHT